MQKYLRIWEVVCVGALCNCHRSVHCHIRDAFHLQWESLSHRNTTNKNLMRMIITTNQQKASPESLIHGWVWFLWFPNLPRRSSPCTIKNIGKFHHQFVIWGKFARTQGCWYFIVRYIMKRVQNTLWQCIVKGNMMIYPRYCWLTSGRQAGHSFRLTYSIRIYMEIHWDCLLTR